MSALSARDHDAELMESLGTRAWETKGPRSGRESTTDLSELEAARSLETSSAGFGMWYPKADRSVRMPVEGRYAKGYPEGVVIHFTAGHRDGGEPNATNTMKDGAKAGLGYFCMSKSGKVYQPAPIDQWGDHAGQSTWPGLGTWISDRLAGIEVCGAGIVSRLSEGRYVPYWNKSGDPSKAVFGEEDVRYAKKGSNVTETAYYLRYTPEQEASLIDLVLWMHLNNPAVFKIENVVGHDEIAVFDNGRLGRKNDPGGSLSMNMPAFREELRQILRLKGNLPQQAPAIDAPPEPPAAPPVS